MDFPSNWSIVIERKTRGSGNDLGTPKKQAATPWSFKEIYRQDLSFQNWARNKR